GSGQGQRPGRGRTDRTGADYQDIRVGTHGRFGLKPSWDRGRIANCRGARCAAVNQGSFAMIRNIGGFAVFAFLAVLGFKLVFSVFGGLLGLVVSVLWWAFIGFVIYTIIKM